MSTRSKSGLLLPLLLVGGAVLYFGGGEVKDAVGGLFASDPVILGSGDRQVLVADGAETDVEHCSAAVVLAERQCGDLKVVIMDAAKMPYIARNIALAWGEGYDYVLTKDAKSRAANYNRSCRKTFVKKYTDGSATSMNSRQPCKAGTAPEPKRYPVASRRVRAAR